MSIAVSIVEDDADFRSTMEVVLRGTPGITFCSAHSDLDDALKELPKRRPDVVVVDLELSGKSGVDCIWHLKTLRPDLALLVLTRFDDTEKIYESLKAGASGYVLKRTPIAGILEAIVEIHEGGSPMTPHIARKVLDCFRRLPSSGQLAVDELTGREEQVLRLSREGLSYKEVASKLGISSDTVRTHFQNIYKKLHVHSRAQAVTAFFKA